MSEENRSFLLLKNTESVILTIITTVIAQKSSKK